MIPEFQFTCPSRSTTPASCPRLTGSRVSIHVPLAEHDLCEMLAEQERQVSIHVPLAEHDTLSRSSASLSASFNSRAPRGARHQPAVRVSLGREVSIHVPLAEHDIRTDIERATDKVSIHVPLAEHDRSSWLHWTALHVSIHVPLAEHDPSAPATVLQSLSFNPRAPRGARHHAQHVRCQCQVVSIHVPLAEHDLLPREIVSHSLCFNSRAPRGARHIVAPAGVFLLKFQFTCPSRSTTPQR